MKLLERKEWLGGDERRRASDRIDVRGYIYSSEMRRLSPIASVSPRPQVSRHFSRRKLVPRVWGRRRILILLALCLMFLAQPSCCTVGLREPFVAVS